MREIWGQECPCTFQSPDSLENSATPQDCPTLMLSVSSKESPYSNRFLFGEGNVYLLLRKVTFFFYHLSTKDMISPKRQTPFQELSGVLLMYHLSGKEMLMGCWPWRGIVMGYTVASAKVRLYLSWEDLLLLWKAIMGCKGI